jgi:hypothetical protein
MTENNKPEWLEIAENDGPIAPPKASKSLPLAALVAVTLILGVGAIVAQTQEEPPANAVETVSSQPTQNQEATPTTSASEVAQTTSVARIANPAASSITTPNAGLKNPSIASLPTSNDDEDDEEDDEGDERSRHGKHHDDDDEGDDD